MLRVGALAAAGAMLAGCSSSGRGSRLVMEVAPNVPPPQDTTIYPDAGGPDSDASDVAIGDASVASCSTPQDCTLQAPRGPPIFCCLRKTCLSGQAAEASTCSDAALQNILASSYDQSCDADTDCVNIKEGNFCDPAANDGCTNAAIRRTALPQYQADLARTQAGVCVAYAGCLFSFAPRCGNGSCVHGGITILIVDAAADAPDGAAETASGEAGDAGTE